MLEAGAEPLSAVLPDGRLTATLTDTIIPSPEAVALVVRAARDASEHR
jgi:hypothetical protein